MSQSGAPESAPSSEKLGLPIQLAHGVGSISFGIKEAGFTTFLLIFYNQVLGYDPQLVSLVLVAALLFDAVIDPLIGHLTDATKSRWGRRLPWLYFAPIPLAIAWTLLWIPPANSAQGYVWLFFVAVAVRALVSCCEIPSVALVPELTRDYDARTRLVRFRFLFGWIGGLVITAAAYGYFLKTGPSNPDGILSASGYAGLGIFGAALMTMSVLASAAMQHRRIAVDNRAERDDDAGHGSFGQKIRAEAGELGEALRHPAFLAVALAGFFAYGSQAINLAIVNYLFLYLMQMGESDIQFYPAVMLAAVLISFFLVIRLQKRLGKRGTASACSIAALSLWSLPFLLITAGLWPQLGSNASAMVLYGVVLLALIANIIVTISHASMVADVVEAHEVETGIRKEGTFFAGNFLVQKCASAMGIFVTGQIVAFAGLSERVLPSQVSPDQPTALGLGYVLAMVITGTAAALAYRRYPITREAHASRVDSTFG